MSKEERIQEIRERESKVPKGPWKTSGGAYIALYAGAIADNNRVDIGRIGDPRDTFQASDKAYDAMAEFISNSREDIPFLLSELSEPQAVPEIDYVEAARHFRRHRFDSALERLDSPENDAVWLKSFVSRIQPAPDTKGLEIIEWEAFSDTSYYDLWCVRRVGSKAFGEGFHVRSKAEAEGLLAELSRVSGRG